MYKIIGADQKEYGPITAEQMAEWISQGRANQGTMAMVDGGTGWKPLVQFPEFSAALAAKNPPVFSGNMPFQPSESNRSTALSRVQGPAIGLITIAILGFINCAVGFVLIGTGTALNFGGLGDSESARLGQLVSGSMGIVSNIVTLILSVVVLMGGLKMKKLEGHTLCITASTAAMIPCFSPCCLIGIPLGIWALTTLNKPEVKSQFR